MKHLLLLLSFLAFTTTTFSQMARDHHTASAGLLAAANFNSIRVTDDILDEGSYTFKRGWSAGIYFNLPLGHAFSIEPQLTWSLYDFGDNARSAILPYGKLSYFTLPVLLKLHATDDIAFTLGPQFDFFHKLHRAPVGVLEENFASTNIGLSLGIELFSHEPISLFGRYVHGLTDLDNRDDDAETEYFNTQFQAGFKLRLFGSTTPADTDADGIIDRDDKCPTVFGLAGFMGCPDTDGDGFTDAEDECPIVAGVAKYNGCPVPDTDGDGVNDEMDKCLTVAGVAKYEGCPIPDTDGDGVNDDDDKCITVAGMAKYDGCPIPDTDGDGVNDETDQCPTVAGLAQFAGCPNPDKDNDGVPDNIDLCPNIPGPASNDGCPVVENKVFNTRMINFETGKATLTADSKRSLKEGAALLNSGDFAKLKIEVQGHTDHVGSNESNHTLSHRRADAVRLELIKNGVSPDRLTATGYGEEKPIADNTTAEGRALNRRVELKPRE